MLFLGNILCKEWPCGSNFSESGHTDCCHLLNFHNNVDEFRWVWWSSSLPTEQKIVGSNLCQGVRFLGLCTTQCCILKLDSNFIVFIWVKYIEKMKVLLMYVCTWLFREYVVTHPHTYPHHTHRYIYINFSFTSLPA
jgi:hypothetical protein